MSLSAITPTEKSENLIYALLPVSISLWLASIISPGNLDLWFSIIAITSPFITIILYEVGIDDKLVKEVYRKKLGEERKAIRLSITKYKLYVKLWNVLLEKPPEGDELKKYIENDVTRLIQETTSSYPIKKRFWRIRGTFYLIVSVPFLLYSALIANNSLSIFDTNFTIFNSETRLIIYIVSSFLLVIMMFVGEFRYKLEWITNLSYYLFVPFLVSSVVRIGSICYQVDLLWLEGIIIIEGIIIAVNLIRHSRLKDHLLALATFLELRMLVSLDATRNPEAYRGNTVEAVVKSELESIELTLNRGDWAVFIPRWVGVRRNIEVESEEQFKSQFMSTTHRLMGQFMKECIGSTGNQAKRKLIWYIYQSSWMEQSLEGANKSFLKFLTAKLYEEDGLIPLGDFRLLLSRFPKRFLEENGELSQDMMMNSISLAAFIDDNTESFHHSITLLAKELCNPTFDDAIRYKSAKIILQYSTERGVMDIFGENAKVDELVAVYKYVQDDENRINLLLDFFSSASTESMFDALEIDMWADQFHEEDSDLKKLIEQRVGDLPKGYFTESDSKFANSVSKMLDKPIQDLGIKPEVLQSSSKDKK